MADVKPPRIIRLPVEGRNHVAVTHRADLLGVKIQEPSLRPYTATVRSLFWFSAMSAKVDMRPLVI